MKKFKLFLIVSVLLCLVFSAIACDLAATTDDSDTIKDVPPVTVDAESIKSNFMTVEYPEVSNGFSSMGNLSEKYGTLTSSYTDNLLVFRKETVDYMNKVTETFTVYSLSKGDAVATFTHQYENEDFYRYDDFGNPVLPSSEMTVDVSTVAYSSIDYIMVTNITNTPIDESFIEENSLSDSYSHSYSFEYYDAEGTHIATTQVADSARLINYNNDVAKVSFGKTYAIMDIAENKLIKTYDGDVTSEYISYSYSNDRYNYSLYCRYGAVDYGTPIGGNGRIEVYTKGGTLVCSYVYSDYAYSSTAFVLANGDIMIQYLYITDKIDCDIVMDGMNLDLQTLILDVETGKTSEVEFNYFIGELYDTDDLIARAREEGILLTFNENNVRNIALAIKIENGTTNAGVTDMIFFDDLLNVNYVLDKVIPDQNLKGTYRPLSNGYFLVGLVSEANAQAIVKDGKVVTYVPMDATVTDYAIITDEGIYDFSMNLVYDISPDSTDDYYSQPHISEFNVYAYMGKYVVYTVENYAVEVGENEYEYKDVVMTIDTVDGWWSRHENSFVTDHGDSYITIYEGDSKTYNVYSTVGEMCHLIETKHPVTIIECSDGETLVCNVTFGDRTQAYLFELYSPEY